MSTVVAKKETELTQKVFAWLLRGSGGRHVFATFDELANDGFEQKVRKAEQDFGVNAWDKTIGIVTSALNETQGKILKAQAQLAGYIAQVSDAEAGVGDVVIKYSLISLVRYDTFV